MVVDMDKKKKRSYNRRDFAKEEKSMMFASQAKDVRVA